MGKIFYFIGRFKPQDEFVWKEYIAFLKFEETLLDLKIAMVQEGKAPGEQFLTDTAKEQEEIEGTVDPQQENSEVLHHDN